jgi:hypothetical protein
MYAPWDMEWDRKNRWALGIKYIRAQPDGKYFKCGWHLKYVCNLARYWLQSVWGWQCGWHLKYACNLARYWLQSVWGWQCGWHLKYVCNLARYWLQSVWGWHDSVETCTSVIICEIIAHLLVTVQNNKRYTVHTIKIRSELLLLHDNAGRHVCAAEAIGNFEWTILPHLP